MKAGILDINRFERETIALVNYEISFPRLYETDPNKHSALLGCFRSNCWQSFEEGALMRGLDVNPTRRRHGQAGEFGRL